MHKYFHINKIKHFKEVLILILKKEIIFRFSIFFPDITKTDKNN